MQGGLHGDRVTVLGLAACRREGAIWYASGDRNTGATVWSVGEGGDQEVWSETGVTQIHPDAAVSADGTTFAYTLDAGGVRRERLDGNSVQAVQETAPAHSREFRAGGSALAGYLDDTALPLHAWTSQARTLATFGRTQTGLPVASHTGTVIYSTETETGWIDRWDVSRNAALPPLADIDATGGVLAVVPDDSLVAQGSNSGTLRATTASREPLSELRTGDGPVRALVVTFDGARFARASGEVVVVHDTASGSVLQRFDLEDRKATLLAFDPTGTHLFASLSDGSVVRWPSPALDADSASLKAGADSNLRVCADTFDVVPDTPFPAADTRWAPAEACAAAPGDIAR